MRKPKEPIAKHSPYMVLEGWAAVRASWRRSRRFANPVAIG